MLLADHSGDPDVTAYVLSRSLDRPSVIIGEEVVQIGEKLRRGSGRPSAGAVEGAAMLAVNARALRKRPELAVFHAGAVAFDDDAAVLVGRSESGKSTTALSLLMAHADARPLSDEFAIVNTATGEIEAFPRLFSIRPGTRRMLGLSALSLPWDAVEPEGVLTRSWATSARDAAFFFIEGRAKTAHVRDVALSEAIFLGMPSILSSVIERNRMTVIDDLVRAFTGRRLYALTLGAPEQNAAIVRDLTRRIATAA
jgi:hypothetical protein